MICRRSLVFFHFFFVRRSTLGNSASFAHFFYFLRSFFSRAVRRRGRRRSRVFSIFSYFSRVARRRLALGFGAVFRFRPNVDLRSTWRKRRRKSLDDAPRKRSLNVIRSPKRRCQAHRFGACANPKRETACLAWLNPL